MATGFKPDFGSLASILRGAPVVAVLHAHAAEIADRAKSAAPVATGEYRDSIHVIDTETDRAVSRVIATAPHALIVEARTGNLKRAIG